MEKQTPLDILKSHFGHTSFRHNQLEIIENAISGKDTLAILPTGGGKSLCFQIPALLLPGVTIVVSPLISLMQDQVNNLAEYGIKACSLNSSQDYQTRRKLEQDIESGTIKLVYVSPEGLVSGHLLELFGQIDVSLIAIDEAHCVSQWGHEFRKDYMQLGLLKNEFPGVPILALTATADEKTREDICLQLKLRQPQLFLSTFDRPNIFYQVQQRSDELKQLVEFIDQKHSSDTGIVYCLSRKKVEKVAEKLKKKGFPAYAYHAGLSTKQREKVGEIFSSDQRVIVVATIAFGMGIDRPDVRFVAHLDLPKNIEAYYQETGRAGRDGEASNAWMVYGHGDVIKLNHMLQSTDASALYKKQAKQKLEKLLDFCEGTGCRRKFLLAYFGEKTQACGHCDECLGNSEKIDVTLEAQMVLSTVFKTGQRFGTGHVVNVLRGSQNQNILQRQHDQLSVYGIGKGQKPAYWNAIIRQLLAKGFLEIENMDFKNLRMTHQCRGLLKGEEKLHIRKISAPTTSKKTSPLTSIFREETARPELFEELRSLRTQIAKKKKVPPYFIFSDKTLGDMCHILPRNKDEFLMVSGVGEKKCREYGQQFLSVVEGHL